MSEKEGTFLPSEENLFTGTQKDVLSSTRYVFLWEVWFWDVYFLWVKV